MLERSYIDAARNGPDSRLRCHRDRISSLQAMMFHFDVYEKLNLIWFVYLPIAI